MTQAEQLKWMARGADNPCEARAAAEAVEKFLADLNEAYDDYEPTNFTAKKLYEELVASALFDISLEKRSN